MALHDAKAQRWHARDGDASAPGLHETATLPKHESTSSAMSLSLILSSASPTASSPAPSTAPSPTASSVPYDLNVSNGTCYYAPDEPMDPGFIPCGNAASGTKACCWKGDVCLGDEACFGIHDGVYTTYMGGCTDATDTLANSNCPQKPQPYAREPWIGLAYCNGTSDEWIACPQAASPPVIKGAGPCVCPAVTQQRIVAFRDASVLPSYASLPTAQGASIQWLGGYTPTMGTADATGAETTGASSATRIDSPTAGRARTPLIVGLSVGLSGIVLLALAGILSFCRKRAQREKTGKGKRDNTGDAGGQGAVGAAVARDAPKEADAPQTVSTISELEMRPARPWSLRSELDGGYPVEIGSPDAGTGAGAGAGAGADGGQSPRFSRMGSGRLSYGLLSPMTTGPSLAEALEVPAQMTGSSTVSAQTTAHAGQTADGQRRQSSMHAMHAMHAMHNGRPPIETLVELE